MHRDLHADSSPSTLFCYVVHLKSKTNTTSWLAQVLSKWPPTLTYGELNNTEIFCHHHSHKLLSPMLNVGLITNCRQILSFRQPISLTNFRVYRVFNFLCPASCWLSLISFCRNRPLHYCYFSTTVMIKRVNEIQHFDFQNRLLWLSDSSSVFRYYLKQI